LTKEQIDAMKKFLESNNEKYNIGNILYWENNLILVGTPFGLDILDLKEKENNNKICSIHLNDNQINNELNNIIYNISDKIYDKEYGSCFIIRDYNNRIKYIRPPPTDEESHGYRIIKSTEYFDDLENEIKLNRFKFNNIFYLIYILISFLLPLASGFLGHYDTFDFFDFKFPYLIVLTSCYGAYALFAFGSKGFVYDINDKNNVIKTITYKIIYIIFIIAKACANTILSFWFCKVNKTGIIFVICLFSIYLIHLIAYFLIYISKRLPLKTYWISYIFYQLSRACIFIFFIVSIFFEFNHVETYYYTAVLCIILLYMYMADYFNILMKDIVYNNYLQAIINYPMEWMNLLCCCCITPKDCIKENNVICYICIVLFPIFIALYIIILVVSIILFLLSTIFFIPFDICCNPCFNDSMKENPNNNENEKKNNFANNIHKNNDNIDNNINNIDNNINIENENNFIYTNKIY